MDLSSLPERLVPDDNVFRMLANCHALCAGDANFHKLSNARRTNSDMAHLFDERVKAFLETLRRNRVRGEPHRLRSVAELRQHFATSSVEEALICAGALLQALSAHIVEKEGKRFRPFEHCTMRPTLEPESPEVLIVPRPCNRIDRRLGPFPRLCEEIGETIAKYHPELHISPMSLGGRDLVRIQLPRGSEERLRGRINSGHLTIGVSPLARNAAITGRSLPGFPDTEPSRFLLDSTGNEDQQARQLAAMLESCHERGVSILVLPELRMPVRLLEELRSFLGSQTLDINKGLLLVVAGSWHQQDGAEWVNRCHVLGCRGETIWTHDKLIEYNILPKNLTPALKKALQLNDYGGIECIRRGNRIEFCDSALGRLAVAICVGFFHDEVQPMLKAAGATWFFVPAMTPDADPLERTARALVTSQRATTVVANCATIGGAKACSFIQFPMAGSEAQRIPNLEVADGVFVLEFNEYLTFLLTLDSNPMVN